MYVLFGNLVVIKSLYCLRKLQMTSKIIYFGTRYCVVFPNHIPCPEASNICEDHSNKQSLLWRERDVVPFLKTCLYRTRNLKWPKGKNLSWHAWHQSNIVLGVFMYNRFNESKLLKVIQTKSNIYRDNFWIVFAIGGQIIMLLCYNILILCLGQQESYSVKKYENIKYKDKRHNRHKRHNKRNYSA